MAKLVLSFKGKTIAEHSLDKDRVLIGRRPDADVRIDNLAVSGQHAAVVSIYNYHFLEDLGSTNGTFVNGNEVKKQVLNHDDVITIGKHELRYVNEAIAVGSALDKTVAIRRVPPAVDAEPQATAGDAGPPAPAAAPAAAEPAAPAPASGGEPPTAAAYLRFLNGPSSGRRLNLFTASTTLGRQGAQLAVIVRRNGQYYLSPGAGPSAPLVNGKGIDGGTPLRDRDIVEIGGTRMEFVTRGR